MQFNLRTQLPNGPINTNTFQLGTVAARPQTLYGNFNLFNNSVHTGPVVRPVTISEFQAPQSIADNFRSFGAAGTALAAIGMVGVVLLAVKK